MLSAFGVVSWAGAPIRLGPANLRPQYDDRERRGVLGAAILGTVVGVRCAVVVQGSPTGRGAGSLCHAPPSRRAFGINSY